MSAPAVGVGGVAATAAGAAPPPPEPPDPHAPSSVAINTNALANANFMPRHLGLAHRRSRCGIGCIFSARLSRPAWVPYQHRSPARAFCTTALQKPIASTADRSDESAAMPEAPRRKSAQMQRTHSRVLRERETWRSRDRGRMLTLCLRQHLQHAKHAGHRCCKSDGCHTKNHLTQN